MMDDVESVDKMTARSAGIIVKSSPTKEGNRISNQRNAKAKESSLEGDDNGVV